MANSIQQVLRRRLTSAIQGLPVIIGNEAVNFTLDRFTNQNWLDTGAESWPPRKAGQKGNRALLVKSGRLRRANRVIETGPLRVVIGNDSPYARAHNDGFSGTVSVSPFTRKKFKSSKVGTGKVTKSGKERMRTVKSISGSIEVKGHTRRMNLPRRRFMGKSHYLALRLTIVGRHYLINEMNNG